MSATLAGRRRPFSAAVLAAFLAVAAPVVVVACVSRHLEAAARGIAADLAAEIDAGRAIYRGSRPAVPVVAGQLLRRLVPTRQTVAGAAVGLALSAAVWTGAVYLGLHT